MEFTGERFLPGTENNDELSVEHWHRYHTVLPFVNGKKVLDIACGEGYGAALLANTAKEVIGIDINQETVDHASIAYSKYPNLSFAQGEAINIALPDSSFDTVISFETIEHITAADQKIFLSEVARVLKEEGIFIISTPDKNNYSERYEHTNHFHLHELNRSEFDSLLADYFSHVRFYEQGFDIISAITPAVTKGLETIKAIEWRAQPKRIQRKYLIAIASNRDLVEKDISSVVFDTDKDYFKQVDRILQLQDEVEERSEWALRLDKENKEKDTTIIRLQGEVEHMAAAEKQLLLKQADTVEKLVNIKVELINRHQEILQQKEALQESQKEELNSLTRTLANKENELITYRTSSTAQAEIIQTQKQELDRVQHTNFLIENELANLKKQLHEKEQFINDIQFNTSLIRQQLSEINNRLLTIYDSEGWKLLSKYYNLKGRLLPEDSKRYNLLKKAINYIRQKNTDTRLSNLPKEKIKPSELPTLVEEIVLEKKILPLYESPTVSIIIPVYNAWEVNYKCVAAILANTSDVTYEVIIADDCSTDMTKDIGGWFENIVHIRTARNLGFLENCNNAAVHAKGAFIHFLNNDTEVRDGWLSSLVNLMNRDEKIGICGSKLIYPDGRLQEAGGIIWNDASGWNYGNGQDPNAPEFNYVKEVDYISGASWMIRNDLWKEVGGFDKRYIPAYCEDSDLAFAVREKGYKVVYQPLSEVIHYEGYSHGSDQGKSSISSIKEYQKINNRKFFEKWKLILERDQFPNAKNVFQARDRSRNKPTLLMIDHYVPQFDKDAGSRTTFGYLELFVKMGYNVKFLGENFYKHEPYTTILQQLGIEVLYGPWYKDNWQQWFIESNEKFKYVYLNRPHISIQFVDFIKRHSKAKILYYGHDLHFLREQRKFALEKNPAILDEVERWKKIETFLFDQSDVILTPSEEEEKIIRALNQSYNVQVIRPFIYKKLQEPTLDFSKRKDLLFVGGFGHAPNVDGVLWFVKEVWPVIKEKLPEVKFIIVGSNAPKEITSISDPSILFKGYVSDEELNNLYKQVRVIVIPLRYGAGIKGKTLEAMYHGIPIVSTYEGIDGLPGDMSFIKVSDTYQSFAYQTIELYSNEVALVESSKNNIQFISDFFTEEKAQEIIIKALETPPLQ